MKRKTIISAIVFILAGQLIALLTWWLFNENYFIILLLSSLIGFIVSFKRK